MYSIWMKKEGIDRILVVLKRGRISITDLAKQTDLLKRRLWDVLPILEALGLIDRSERGIVTWIQKEEKIDNHYPGNKLQIHTIGAITSVMRHGMQGVLIEQTASGFNVNSFKSED